MLATTRGGGARRAPWGGADGPSGGLSGIGSRRFAPTWFRFGARSRPALRRMPALASWHRAGRRPGGSAALARSTRRRFSRLQPERIDRGHGARASGESWPANGGGGTDRPASVDAGMGRRRSRGSGPDSIPVEPGQPLQDHDFAHCLGKLVSGPPDMLRPMGRRVGGAGGAGAPVAAPGRLPCPSHGPARMAKEARSPAAPLPAYDRRDPRPARPRVAPCSASRAMRGPGDRPPGLSRRFRAGSRRREGRNGWRC